MYKIGEEELVFCPYNRYHMVSKLRIQKHIIKCKKNYPDVKLATCFYNYTHRLRPEDMLKHYEICSQKTRIDGARYSEPYCVTSSNSSVKSHPLTKKFPDINVKPRVFAEPSPFSSSSSQTACDDRDSDSSGSVIDYPQMICDDTDSDSDLEPLPLPKTISKAFVNVRKEAKNLTPHTPQPKSFGRGKNLSLLSQSEKNGTSDQLPSSSQVVGSAKTNRNKGPVFFQKGNTGSISSSVLQYKAKPGFKDCRESITSSMFDDVSTFKSMDIISEDESIEEDDDNDGFVFTKFNKYVKI